MWTRTDRQRPTSPRKSVACMAQLLAGNNSSSNKCWAMSPKSPPINTVKRRCIFYWPQNHRATLFASSSARLIPSEWAMATVAGPGAFIVNTGDTFITARWLLGAMAGGGADHRRGRSACGGLADGRLLHDLVRGGPPVAVWHVNATSGHARRQPTRVSARARERSDTSLAAVTCCAFRWLITVGAS